MCLTKNIIKYIRSLKDKKHRTEHNTFVVEGRKMVEELLHKLDCQLLVTIGSEINLLNTQKVEKILEVKEADIAKISFLKNPQPVLAVFHKPKQQDVVNLENKLSLILDEIQDPGNLGTIVRIADWYGIENIFCAFNSADIYNPKTVQATMGALSRVNVHYVDLEIFLQKNLNIPIYGTFLDGKNMYEEEITKNGFIVIGNEGNGISPMVEKFINQKLFIPSYPIDSETSESLNAAVATAIICAEFRRRTL